MAGNAKEITVTAGLEPVTPRVGAARSTSRPWGDVPLDPARENNRGQRSRKDRGRGVQRGWIPAEWLGGKGQRAGAAESPSTGRRADGRVTPGAHRRGFNLDCGSERQNWGFGECGFAKPRWDCGFAKQNGGCGDCGFVEPGRDCGFAKQNWGFGENGDWGKEGDVLHKATGNLPEKLKITGITVDVQCSCLDEGPKEA